MIVKLNEQEANALIQLIDLAVKSGGLQVAQAGAELHAKIIEAGKEEKEEDKD